MKKIHKLLTALLLFSVITFSQNDKDKTYFVPFLSSDNNIELTVENVSQNNVSVIIVSAVNPPDWLKFKSKQQVINLIEPNAEQPVDFIFSVDKSAPVNKQHTILFSVTTPSGESWSKEIKISVNPPDRFELYQNYPNPFNPVTTIAYQLPNDAHINLKIFDIVGREVRTVLNEVKEAGYYEVEFVASELPSSVYFYQITVKDQSGKTTVARKKMILLR